MSFNGSGVYTPPAPSFPAVANTLIESAKFNAVVNDIATALTTCLTKDGQTTPTANLPMGGFRHTGVGDATVRGSYPSAGQAQDGVLNWATAGGTADAITATYSPAITALVDGQTCCVRAGSANATTTPTFSPNAITARTITKLGGAAVVAGEWVADQELILRYKLASTRWELTNPRKIALADGGTGASTAAGARTALGSGTVGDSIFTAATAIAVRDLTTTNGADIASATTTNLTTATGDTVDVTGTTTITGITLADGDERRVRFTGALVLTHGASLVLPGAANITTAAGDIAVFRGYASSVVRCVNYQKASGTAVVAPSTAGTLTGGSSIQQSPYSPGGITTTAHGLGGLPAFLDIYLECLTAELGYSVGDKVYGNAVDNNVSGNGFSVTKDATNITIVSTTAPYLQHKTTTTTTIITAANWRVVVIPYRLN